jgi:hypothetical protein
MAGKTPIRDFGEGIAAGHVLFDGQKSPLSPRFRSLNSQATAQFWYIGPSVSLRIG